MRDVEHTTLADTREGFPHLAGTIVARSDSNSIARAGATSGVEGEGGLQKLRDRQSWQKFVSLQVRNLLYLYCGQCDVYKRDEGSLAAEALYFKAKTKMIKETSLCAYKEQGR